MIIREVQIMRELMVRDAIREALDEGRFGEFRAEYSEKLAERV